MTKCSYSGEKSRDFLKRWQYNDILFYLFIEISGVVDRK